VALRYPAFKAHAPSYMLSVACPALPHFFPHYLIKGTIFRGKLLNLNCSFFIFSTASV